MTDGKNTLIGSGGTYLSGGQAKRLAFARTLCHDKPILILDDPFSALDKNTEKQAFVPSRERQTRICVTFPPWMAAFSSRFIMT